MNRIWEAVVQTAMAGAGRSPLPQGIAEALDLPAASDATQTALLGLATAHVLRKAAAPLPDAPQKPFAEPCPPDSRPWCSPAALRDLEVMLVQGAFQPALPEFFRLLAGAGKRLPPQALPGMLDFLERRRTADPQLLTALEPAGSWLARQNPQWAGLWTPTAADWDTGAFSERLALLGQARRTRPLAGLALLEKTWPKERPEHRLQFLACLREGLSLADEPLLERARADMSRPVRLEACRLLLLLPESQLTRAALSALPKTNQKPEDSIRRLEQALPAEGPFSKLQLLALTGQTANPAAGLLQVLPGSQLAAALGCTPDGFLAVLAQAPDDWLEAALDYTAWACEPDASAAAVRFFNANPQHPARTSPALEAILRNLPQATWQQMLPLLANHDDFLETPDSALVRALAGAETPWPKALTTALLGYPLRAGKPRHWQPPPHFRALLQTAAYHCAPADAEELAQRRPEGDMPYAWHSELMQLWSIARFRRQLRIHLSP